MATLRDGFQVGARVRLKSDPSVVGTVEKTYDSIAPLVLVDWDDSDYPTQEAEDDLDFGTLPA